MPHKLHATFTRRVILVVLDGLRPDAIERYRLPSLTSLLQRGAYSLRAQTVQPSVTACAMASLVTGAHPRRHGFQSDRFGLPRQRGTLHPLPRVLRDHGYQTSAFLAQMPMLMMPLAYRIASLAGVERPHFSGKHSLAILSAATRTIGAQSTGFILLHWPDGDRAGHAKGWMSREYEMAARSMDCALGALSGMLALQAPDTVLMVMADHGGGGACATNHDSTHALDTTIPIILTGTGVHPGEMLPDVSLLDVPATILWLLGMDRPDSYAGRVLYEAFSQSPVMSAGQPNPPRTGHTTHLVGA